MRNNIKANAARLTKGEDRRAVIRSAFSRGMKLTISEIVAFENVTRATIVADLKILVNEGLIDYTLIANISSDAHINTKLYRLAK